MIDTVVEKIPFTLCRMSLLFCVLLVNLTMVLQAQDNDITMPAMGDVPVASRIQIAQDDDDPTQVVVAGDIGAVYANAFVVVQNLYTAEREIVGSSSDGSFSVGLSGQGQTPYWVGAFQRFPSDDAILSAQGTLVYGSGGDNTVYIESDFGGLVSRYQMWGDYSSSQVTAGDMWSLNLTIEMDIVDGALGFGDFQLGGELYFLPIQDVKTDIHAEIPVPILGRTTLPIPLATGETVLQLISGTTLQLEIQFNDVVMPEPADMGHGQLGFVGTISAGDGVVERWHDSVLLGTHGDPVTDMTVYFPLWLSYVEASSNALIWQLPFEQQNPEPIYAQLQPIMSPDTYSLEPIWTNPLDVPIADGQVTVNITKPDGTLDVIDVDITQVNRLLTGDKSMLATNVDPLSAYPMLDYGEYVVQVNGRLRIGEQSYFSVETQPYPITIAEPLTLSPSILAGTPLEVGDVIPVGLHIQPQVPADVWVTFYYLDGTNQPIELQGKANRYGYYSGEPIVIEQSGAYAIAYQAEYVDSSGRLWSGNRLSIGVIDNPNTDGLAQGRRGVVGYEGVNQAWFDTRVFPNDDINASRQVYYPFYSGDVAMIPDASDSGVYPYLSRQADESAYLTVTRPDVILRQAVMEGDDSTVAFDGDTPFNQGVGAGVDGLRSGDYAFLFGGVTSPDDSRIYGALMVVEDDDAPARVLSPFMDDITVFGQTVDLLFVPTSIRPAQVLNLGDTLSIAGQVAPTLPADVEVIVRSPSGKITRYADVANAIGYFYSMENDITVDETGIWSVEVKIRYQGETSAGYLERPFPQGQLVYDIYVVSDDNPPLIDTEFVTDTRNVTQTFSLTIPDGWTDVRAFATVTTPSAILSRQELTVFPAGTSYTYNPTQLSREYPNVELLETADGNHVADVLTLTLVMTGLDAEGQSAIRTQTYNILHDVTYATGGVIGE